MSHSLYEVIMYVVDNTSLVDIPFMLTELLARTLGQIRIYYSITKATTFVSFLISMLSKY